MQRTKFGYIPQYGYVTHMNYAEWKKPDSKKEMQEGKMVEEALQIAEKRR